MSGDLRLTVSPASWHFKQHVENGTSYFPPLYLLKVLPISENNSSILFVPRPQTLHLSLTLSHLSQEILFSLSSKYIQLHAASYHSSCYYFNVRQHYVLGELLHSMKAVTFKCFVLACILGVWKSAWYVVGT